MVLSLVLLHPEGRTVIKLPETALVQELIETAAALAQLPAGMLEACTDEEPSRLLDDPSLTLHAAGLQNRCRVLVREIPPHVAPNQARDASCAAAVAKSFITQPLVLRDAMLPSHDPLSYHYEHPSRDLWTRRFGHLGEIAKMVDGFEHAGLRALESWLVALIPVADQCAVKAARRHGRLSRREMALELGKCK